MFFATSFPISKLHIQSHIVEVPRRFVVVATRNRNESQQRERTPLMGRLALIGKAAYFRGIDIGSSPLLSPQKIIPNIFCVATTSCRSTVLRKFAISSLFSNEKVCLFCKNQSDFTISAVNVFLSPNFSFFHWQSCFCRRCWEW